MKRRSENTGPLEQNIFGRQTSGYDIYVVISCETAAPDGNNECNIATLDVAVFVGALS